MPELEKIRAQVEPHGVGFLAVALTDHPDAARAAAEHIGIRMPVAVAHGEVLGPNGVRSVPSILFVDAQGRIVDSTSGARPSAELLERAWRLAPQTPR